MKDELLTRLDKRLSACNLSVTSCIVANNKYVRDGQTDSMLSLSYGRDSASVPSHTLGPQRGTLCLQTFVLSGT